MSGESGANRWWENYLVRYLMPSIAGVAIVGWLLGGCGQGLRALLFLPPKDATLDTAYLTLIFLYGNLFCYVASYPILGFHVTRVIDFDEHGWRHVKALDGYLFTLFLVAACWIGSRFGTEITHYREAFLAASVFAAIQLLRLVRATRPRVNLRGVDGAVSPAFGFAFSLARRRGLLLVTETSREGRREIAWRQDFMATYRHLREHGNSAFIFISEIALAVLVRAVTGRSDLHPREQLGAVAALLSIWATPAIFVHLLGQHLERRFSQYDRRRAQANQPRPTNRPRERAVSAEVTIVKWRT